MPSVESGKQDHLQSQFRLRSDGIVWRELDGEIIVLEMETGAYLNLNGSARVLWEALAQEADTATLATLLVESFGIREDRARADTEAFLDELAQRSLVEPVA